MRNPDARPGYPGFHGPGEGGGNGRVRVIPGLEAAPKGGSGHASGAHDFGNGAYDPGAGALKPALP